MKANTLKLVGGTLSPVSFNVTLRYHVTVLRDKGFDIGLHLNIPPFLKEKPQFDENEVIRAQTIAKHRIHVERAIGKVKRFLIFNSKLPISSLGT